MFILLLLGGLVALVAGAEAFVRGASRGAALLGVPPLVIGLTVVALGTSAPEIGISVSAAYAGSGDLALGNVVGSNLFNILVILGLAAVIMPLVVARRLVRIDVPIMIAVTALAVGMALDGSIGRIDGAILLALGVAYLVFMAVAAWRDGRRAAVAADDEFDREYHAPARHGARTWLLSLGLLLAGLVGLVLGSQWFVAGAVGVARMLGVSELIIGLTIVAAGTSLPEVATSVIAALRGERDIAAGNVIGSNIFNIVLVLGAAGVVAPAGVSVASQAMAFDLPVMLAVTVACLPIFLTGHRIDRWTGALFLIGYGVYLTWLVLGATLGQGWVDFPNALLWFVMPLTLMTGAALWYRWRYERHRPLDLA